MLVEDTLHYQLDTEEGIEQWAQLVPSDGGQIFIASEDAPQTLSMFHQLRCLDTIRAAIVASHTPPDSIDREEGSVLSGRVRHCMNYLRQVRSFLAPHVRLLDMHTFMNY